MRISVLMVVFAAAMITAAIKQVGSETARVRIVEEVHRKLQSQFDDLKNLDKGFGVSRIEINKVLRHPIGSPGGYDEDGWRVGIGIYGNDGKPLDAAKLKLKYTRFGAESAVRVVENPAADALKKFAKGQTEPYVWRRGDMVVEARFFRLTDKKCLGCHTGMKLNDPVAIGIYRADRIGNKVKP